MKSYSIYIFDLDGTLTDTTQVWLEIFRDCLIYFKITSPDDLTLAQHTHDWKQMLLLGLPESNLDEFISLAHKLAKERLPKSPMHTGAFEMLEELNNRKKKIGIFTTLDRPIFEEAMRYRELEKVVEIAVAGTDIGYRKPHPAGILKVLDGFGVQKDDYKHVVYIGDKDTDIQAAHNAGIDAVLYYPSSHQVLYDIDALKEHKPEYIITKWEELLYPYEKTNN